MHSFFNRFKFKNDIKTTNSRDLDKQNIPHFLARFWFEGPIDSSYLTALRKNEDMVMNGRFEFREDNMMSDAILSTLISRK